MKHEDHVRWLFARIPLSIGFRISSPESSDDSYCSSHIPSGKKCLIAIEYQASEEEAIGEFVVSYRQGKIQKNLKLNLEGSALAAKSDQLRVFTNTYMTCFIYKQKLRCYQGFLAEPLKGTVPPQVIDFVKSVADVPVDDMIFDGNGMCILTAGEVRCGGNSYFLNYVPQKISSPNLKIKQLVFGYHSAPCVVYTDNNVECWGQLSGGLSEDPRLIRDQVNGKLRASIKFSEDIKLSADSSIGHVCIVSDIDYTCLYSRAFGSGKLQIKGKIREFTAGRPTCLVDDEGLKCAFYYVKNDLNFPAPSLENPSQLTGTIRTVCAIEETKQRKLSCWGTDSFEKPKLNKLYVEWTNVTHASARVDEVCAVLNNEKIECQGRTPISLLRSEVFGE